MNKHLTFEDLSSLDHSAWERLLTEISDEILAYALKGASPLTQQAVYSHLPIARADRIKQITQEASPLPVAVVEDAQITVVDAFRRLVNEEEIIFA